MADRSFLLLNDAGLNRLRARVDELGAGAKKVMDLAGKTLARRLPVRAADLVAEKILNAPRNKVRGYLSAKTSGYNVILLGVEKRMPLKDFSGTRYGGRNTPGAVVEKWRDSPAETYSAARASTSALLEGGAFAIKGRGVKGGIYNRIIKKHPSGRQVLALRKGPSFARAITERRHGDIIPDLVEAGREVLRAEIERLLKARF